MPFGLRPVRALHGLGGYAIYSYIPGFAWLTWACAYKATRRPSYLVFAILYAIPLLVLFAAIGDEFMDEDLTMGAIVLLILGLTAAIVDIHTFPPKVPGPPGGSGQT